MIDNNIILEVKDKCSCDKGMDLNSEQESRSIFRLGRSDTWACKNCKQKGDVHYMREHMCRGEIK